MIKPVSGSCNLNCEYCFYKDEMKNRKQASFGKMEKVTYTALIRSVLDSLVPGEAMTFGFQGGEPLLAGLSFYEDFVETVEQLNEKKAEVCYVLQTNGTLLNEAYADFFHEKNFLIGISIDGPKNLHDSFRKNARGEGSFIPTLEAVRLLQQKQVEFNALVVLHRKNVFQIRKIYSFLQKQGIFWMQFIPCLDPLGEEPGTQEYSLPPGLYAEAILTLFDLWYSDYRSGHYVYIRQFENWAGILKGKQPEACSMSGHCAIQNIVEADGQVYPCDFYALDEYALGNVSEYNWKTQDCLFLKESEEIRKQVQKKCAACPYVRLCRSGCRREIFWTGEQWENYFCSAYQKIFAGISGRLYEL